jgi:hypothetical protein
VRINSGKELREQKDSNGRIKGTRRLLTSSANFEALGGRWGAVEPWVDGGRLQLRKKCFGECRPGKPGREKANRRVSRVAGDAAVLTEATDATGTQRRSRNGGSLW